MSMLGRWQGGIRFALISIAYGSDLSAVDRVRAIPPYCRFL